MKIDNKFDPRLAAVIERSIQSNPLAQLGRDLQQYAKDALAMKAQEYKLAAAARSLFGGGQQSGGARSGGGRRARRPRRNGTAVPAQSATGGYNSLVSAAAAAKSSSTLPPFNPTRNYLPVRDAGGSIIDLVEVQ